MKNKWIELGVVFFMICTSCQSEKKITPSLWSDNLTGNFRVTIVAPIYANQYFEVNRITPHSTATFPEKTLHAIAHTGFIKVNSEKKEVIVLGNTAQQGEITETIPIGVVHFKLAEKSVDWPIFANPSSEICDLEDLFLSHYTLKNDLQKHLKNQLPQEVESIFWLDEEHLKNELL